MIAFGIFLLLVAALNPHARVLGGIGVICIVVGLILEVLGTIGHAVGGRRHYY
jgi:membrane-bound ClpP family serine protease